MKRKIIECPICGHLNKYVDLKDSKGWMECEHCGAPGILPEVSGEAFEEQRKITIVYFTPISYFKTGAVS